MIADMAWAFAIFGVAFAAVCIWLMARLTNRGRRPGRRFWIVATLVVFTAYPLSIGPATFLTSRGLLPGWAAGPVKSFCAPAHWLFQQSDWSYEFMAWFLDFWYLPPRDGMM